MVVCMIKSNQHIEIVRSTIAGLSSMSQVSCDAILAVLAKHYTKVGVTVVNNLSDLNALVDSGPDLVFIGMEFIPSDSDLGVDDPVKIWITQYLDEHNISYTGSNHLAHELGRNKSLAKQRVVEAGLQTPLFSIIKQNESPIDVNSTLEFPLFVKPTNRGGGAGIDSDSVVYDFQQLLTKTRSITANLGSDSLVEEYLPGREFSVAILKDEHSDEYLVMPIELIAPLDARGARLLSGEVKSLNTEQAIKVTDKIIKAEVSELAISVFHALGARDYGRIDIRLDKYGTPHFLEANLIPSLISGYGSFPKACVLNIDLNYESMIMKITNLGLNRKINTVEDASNSIMIDDSIFPVTGIALELA